MEDQYGLAGDHHYRQLTAAAQPMFPLADSGHLMMGYHHGHHHHHHHQGFHHHHHHHDLSSEIGGVWSNSNVNTIGTINNAAVEINSCNNGNNNVIGGAEVSNNSRWPRQETLTLLEIRSRLNSRFKDSNQKAPLWDEVSRIMAEEHGYQRSGKKCKEKFENLYKYYKKTKEGKAGRQDGKHYRFFRQLEAIYGDQSNNIQSSPTLMETQYLGRNSLLYDHQSTTPSATINRPTNITNNHESLSFSINSTEFETSSSENNEDDLSAIAFKMNNNRISRVDDRKMKGVIDRHAGRDGNKNSSSSWKAKVENFVDSQMKKIMTTQETWMEKMLKSIMDKEEERLAKEEEWRKQEAARLDQEVGEFWAKEKAWVEARDAALVGALKKIRGKDQSLLDLPSFPERMIARDHIRNVDAKSGNSYSTTSYHRWSEEEISSLIELRTSLEPPTMFEGTSTNVLYSGVNYKEGIDWEEIASKMACLGYCRSANECKEKWESVSVYVTMTSELKKKRREDYYKITSGCYFDGQELEPKQDNHHHHHHHGSNNNNNNNAMGLQLMMDHEGIDNSPSSSNVATQMHPNNFFHLLFGEGENLWDKYGTLRLGKDKNFNQ